MSLGYSVSKTITAANTFTNWLEITGGRATIHISGLSAGTATVTLQRSHDTGETKTNIDDMKTYTIDLDPSESIVDESFRAFYRIGVKTGDYTAGTINLKVVS